MLSKMLRIIPDILGNYIYWAYIGSKKTISPLGNYDQEQLTRLGRGTDENSRKGQRPKSVGQLLGKSKWEKPLCDWIMATGVGLLGPELRDLEAERLEKNDGWRREPFI
jgi:hypothetical protein